MDGRRLLPMPHHSTLNHAYLNKSLPEGLIAVGLTSRFRHKFVSLATIKPGLCAHDGACLPSLPDAVSSACACKL